MLEGLGFGTTIATSVLPKEAMMGYLASFFPKINHILQNQQGH